MRNTFRHLTMSITAAAFGIIGSATVALAEFPEKPITILAYMKPGGAADVDSRKFAVIAERLTGSSFVVKNKTGAGGIVAMKSVLEQSADGYLLMATTKSQVYKVVTAASDIDVEEFEWLALNQRDPEAIITNKDADVNTWEQIVADAAAKGAEGERQIWVGPAAGGLDHVTAMKVWSAAGINPDHVKYVPFQGGKAAMVELLGERGVVYVGNPRDTLGQPKLKVAALSRHARLPDFPDAPTFAELGVSGLDGEIMWRGFAIKAGIPDEARAFWNDLFVKVSQDPEWIEHVEKSSIDPVLDGHDAFLATVKKDMAEVAVWATEAGILN
ncbi:MAG: tripartite tricarboxylate transporter substrate binding protein [Hyphomicrobiales bacterium]|nr:tripartite tricarboxylate transporter substrate binding protein [Hyphomicrobiales bacterium]